MEGKLQRRIQRYGWDRAVSDYERAWRSQLEPAQTRMLKLVAIQPGDRVLDVACGTGLVTFRVAEAVGANGHVVGIDISGEMVENARRRAAECRIANVSFERAGAEELPTEDNAFDVALCAVGLMYVPEPLLAIAEMHRAIIPGGAVAAVVWGRRDHCGWSAIFEIVDARVKTEVCPLFFQLGTGESLKTIFQRAGLEDIRMERIETLLLYDSPADALAAAFVGGPVALAYSRFDEETRNQVHAEYLNSISDFRRADGGYEIPGEFVAVAGRKISR
jgi:ubiquinone/menaquinone biosynthesis C-methylase UbiE